MPFRIMLFIHRVSQTPERFVNMIQFLPSALLQKFSILHIKI